MLDDCYVAELGAHITSLLVSYVISLWYNCCHACRVYVRIIIDIILVHTLKHLIPAKCVCITYSVINMLSLYVEECVCDEDYVHCSSLQEWTSQCSQVSGE